MLIMKNILRISFMFILIIVLSTFATDVASAKTINNSNQFADTARLEYFNNMYERSDYKNYLMSIEYVGSGYNYYTYYYMCMSNEAIEFTDNANASLNCDELIRYYRNGSDYQVDKMSDNNLTVNNSVYYTNKKYEKSYMTEKMLVLLNIGLFSIFLSIGLYKIFRS